MFHNPSHPTAHNDQEGPYPIQNTEGYLRITISQNWRGSLKKWWPVWLIVDLTKLSKWLAGVTRVFFSVLLFSPSPLRLVNLSQQWRSRKESLKIRFLWISSSRGRRESCLLSPELSHLVVLRFGIYHLLVHLLFLPWLTRLFLLCFLDSPSRVCAASRGLEG